MKSYIKKFNRGNFDAFLNARLEAVRAGRFFEAALISTLKIEASVRGMILAIIKDKNLDEERLKKYWDNPNTKFSALIANAELLGVDKKIIEGLEIFRLDRNEIVHNSMHLSPDELRKLSIGIIAKSIDLDESMKKIIGAAPCPCRSGKKLIDCNCDDK